MLEKLIITYVKHYLYNTRTISTISLEDILFWIFVDFCPDGKDGYIVMVCERQVLYGIQFLIIT